ncbi:MAG: Acetyltransferase [Candidatus Fermentimicrarchaeum limneticum]|uniref:Acetyltransferase n=1 Tax=Fermentimicrarchaeum limneticum TaxID=2795018 RepID=A0A7D6BBJ0_FERL1|nr:MAG: Acetyltransferase [Candidatus Fermentimicrarchaeum limneticum]
MNFIDESAKIGKNFKPSHNVVILGNVRIGNNVQVGNNIVIYANVRVGDDVQIQDNSVIGKLPKTSVISSLGKRKNISFTEIGDKVTIGTSCTIYAGTKIGKNCFVGDLASIREGCVIGDSTIVGRAVTMECNTKVGRCVKIQTASHITGNMVIEDYVFLGPEVATMNDKYMGRAGSSFKGPTIKKGARIGGNATILPGVVIGEDAVVGAGSVVTKDVPPSTIVVGVPAKALKTVPKEHLLRK